MASPILAPTGASSSSGAGLRVQPSAVPTYADVVKGVAAAADSTSAFAAAAATPRARRDAPSIDEDEQTPVAAASSRKVADRGLLSKSKSKAKADAGHSGDESGKQVSLTSKIAHVAFEKFFSHFLHGFLFGALANFRYEVQLAGGLWRMVFRRPLPPPTVGQMADPRLPRRLPVGW
ncbi:hypothetical protein BCR44DRAFT_1443675 [Catenaria anguillulae PL171]|uniref:Uncharacterized protein n=1 Tax=Catenaria anguillulae PL171 TaxID=765915 RepID=A0A1Y2H8K8_9FUNG|nr:hypothetical protein BCR44DRAFT_1443675 [Catenaria anguillulae PL171]